MINHSCSQGAHNGKQKMDTCSIISMLGDTNHDKRRWRSPYRIISPRLERSGWVSRRRRGWGEDRRIRDSQSKGGRRGGRECKRRKEQMIMDLESRKCYPDVLLDPAWIIAIVQFKELSLCHGRALRSPSTLSNHMVRALHQTLCLHSLHMEACTTDETLIGR